ncbi:Uma2 family endonuclease [Spirulina sp. 06S082]|uniref:Uma2 family endonuclease n=1 Tax=Spirulina sp. 06S082 TaxID=3110248 RepID=UPI003A4DDC95
MQGMTVKDLDKIQTNLCQAGYDYQLELEDGKIIVMGPSDITSSEIGIRFSAFLFLWVNPRRLGRIFDSSGGFILPDTNIKALDVSFVKAERLRKNVRYFGELVPDLVVEIKSQSDTLKPLREKIQMFLLMGATVGILIDPDRQTVTVNRPNSDPILLQNGDILTIPELFPGWEVAIAELWPPEFD